MRTIIGAFYFIFIFVFAQTSALPVLRTDISEFDPTTQLIYFFGIVSLVGIVAILISLATIDKEN